MASLTTSRSTTTMSFLLLLISSLCICNTAAGSGGRKIVSFNFNWKFRKGLHNWPKTSEEQPPINPNPGLFPPESSVDYDGISNWVDVQLPHDGLIVSFYIVWYIGI